MCKKERKRKKEWYIYFLLPVGADCNRSKKRNLNNESAYYSQPQSLINHAATIFNFDVFCHAHES